MTDSRLIGRNVIDAINHALGYRPLDAIAVALLGDSEQVPIAVTEIPRSMSIGVLRRVVASTAADFMDESPNTTALAVLYLSVPLGRVQNPAGYPFISRLVSKLDARGPSVVAALVVATDCWGEYVLDSRESELVRPRPLSDLRPFEIRRLSSRPAAPSRARSGTGAS